jgi:hypothetical protein
LFTGQDLPWDVETLAPAYAQFWLNALRLQVPVSGDNGDSG